MSGRAYDAGYEAVFLYLHDEKPGAADDASFRIDAMKLLVSA